MCLRVSYEKKKIFFCILKVTEERSWIRSWIRIHQLEVRIRGSGSALKSHGSPTLGITIIEDLTQC
jgi:hypothetical protein